MSLPDRLIATERGLGLDLLKAGSLEHQPPRGMLERTLDRVTVAGAVTTVSALAAAHSGMQLGSAAATAATAHAAKAVTLSAVFLKAVAIGSGVGAIAIATSFGVSHLMDPPLPNPVRESLVTTRATAPSLRAALVVASAARMESPETERAPSVTAHSSSTQTGEPRSAADLAVASLAREASLLHRAQSALERGDADETLEILRRYETEFRSGQLKPEATLVRIRALVMTHEDSAARRLADELLHNSPEGTFADRVREALGH